MQSSIFIDGLGLELWSSKTDHLHAEGLSVILLDISADQLRLFDLHSC